MMPEFTTSYPHMYATFTFAYLLGAIPFGLLLTRAMGLGDVRQIGSGNIGVANVLRTGSKLAAALTLALDAGKGALSVLIARASLGEDAAQLAALAAFIGHCYPVYLQFKGGKGVATFLGTLTALYWPLGLILCAIWLIAAVPLRISSLAALIAAACAPLIALALGQPLWAICTVMAVVIYIRHASNIRRLITGTELNIGQK
jgi:glycerol-3-phosphate acyltransferase PlsY